MKQKEVIIADLSGTYDNPIAELVQVACRFKSCVSLEEGGHCINAKSIMGIMAFQPAEGKKVLIKAEGSDEGSAVSAMEEYLCCH